MSRGRLLFCAWPRQMKVPWKLLKMISQLILLTSVGEYAMYARSQLPFCQSI